MGNLYLDFSRAFDKVDHGILLHKIRELNITDKIGTWIAEFLSNRKQFVRFQGHTSKISDVKSSVPQGTVAGPILFLFLMLDIDLGVESPTQVLLMTLGSSGKFSLNKIKKCCKEI